MKPIKHIKKLLTAALAATMLLAVTPAAAYALTEDNAAEAESSLYITTANLNLRSGPSTDHDRLTLISSGTVVTVTDFVSDGFSAVTFGNLSGYVSSEWITPHVPSSAPANLPAGVQIHGNVELLPWREVRDIMPRNADLHVLDVRTGRTYTVRAWSLGNHADVDPLTATDSEVLRATYGGSWSWDPRPVIVTFNGRSFAAAINGMPHGGSQIAGNGVSGHFCLHFYGSTTHNGNRSYERTMQAAVMEAFNWAANQ